MTQLDIDTLEPRREIDVISKADRYALLRMLETKPRALIAGALRDAARRGFSTDPMLDRVSSQRNKRSASSTMTTIILLTVIIAAGALGASAFVGWRERIPFFQGSLGTQGTQDSVSVMGFKPGDVTKPVSKEEEERNDIAYSRLSEPVRNAFKNHLPETTSTTTTITVAANNTTNTNKNNAKPDVNCASLAPPESNAAKPTSAQNPLRPAEPAAKWIDRMTVLKNAGKPNELKLELKKFRQAYPSIALPPPLQALACLAGAK